MCWRVLANSNYYYHSNWYGNAYLHISKHGLAICYQHKYRHLVSHLFPH